MPRANDPKLREILASPELQKRIYRRTLRIVVLSQIFGGAGLAAGITVGALLAQEMMGADGYAGIPTALFTLGSALSAWLVGRYSQRFGRRMGLTAGFIAGGIGASLVVAAAVLESVVLLFAALFVYGAGTSTNLQARYAGTDLAGPGQRAQAVSIAMVATTLGAVAGPNAVDAMGRVASALGIPALAGPFLLAAAAFFLAGAVLLVFLRPDPLVLAKALAEGERAEQPLEQSRAQAGSRRGIIVGTSVMLLTQIVMVAIMTMTPVHMQHHGHGMGAVGFVIGIHVAAMFLPSLVTGRLVDKLGRMTMSLAAGAVLLVAGLVAAAAPGDSMLVLTIALALLGLGWNFGLISGTAIIVDSTDLSTRARTQGTVDVLIALAGASGGALSGMVVAGSSYAALSFAGGILALLLIPIAAWSRNGRKTEDRGNGA